ncbi:MAG: GTPase HflX [Egibacteraceae bacterium]
MTDEPLELSRAQQRRARAQRIEDAAPQEGVAIFRTAEKAILVGVHRNGATQHDVDASLDELEQLVDTAGSTTVGRIVQRRDVPDTATFIGRGKVVELKALVAELGADAAIFDDELSPAQQRNLEERLGVKVLDRTIVILDIFAQHASSREGRAQVELAQLSYLLPRLRGWGQALSQQAGGIGTRGPGETQLEVDRRKLNRRITRLRHDLLDYERTRRLKTKERERRNVPTAALVGYTNAGKSTLLNRMTGADVLVADRLFATLDTTARRFELPDGREAVVTDTVGFVQKLPTQLVEAFKSTLEDTLRAELLVHVVDASHPEAEAQAATVDQVLDEIGAGAMQRLVVLNKIDVADRDELAGLRRRLGDALTVSARTGEGVEALIAAIACRIPAQRALIEALVPYARTDLVALAHREGEVLQSQARSDGTWLVAKVDRAALVALRPYANGSAPQSLIDGAAPLPDE